MPKERVTDIVEQIALPIVEAYGLDLVDVEYKKEGSDWFLRVFIDKPQGVDIDDCSRVSEKLSDELDLVDPIDNPYFLEVSSPGAERPLKKSTDFAQAVGQRVHVSLYEPMDGYKTFEGTLTSFEGDCLELEYMIKTAKRCIRVPMEKVASARLSVSF